MEVIKWMECLGSALSTTQRQSWIGSDASNKSDLIFQFALSSSSSFQPSSSLLFCRPVLKQHWKRLARKTKQFRLPPSNSRLQLAVLKFDNHRDDDWSHEIKWWHLQATCIKSMVPALHRVPPRMRPHWTEQAIRLSLKPLSAQHVLADCRCSHTGALQRCRDAHSECVHSVYNDQTGVTSCTMHSAHHSQYVAEFN